MFPRKSLPDDLTTYDFLKTFAVVFMIIDHVGFYFFPDDTWWRVAGRLCVPAWFFLIGYARSRDLGLHMWIGAVILVGASLTAGLALFPVNILWTMIFIRLTLNNVMERALRNTSTFWAFNAILFLLILPSSMFFEYGTQGFILAIFGWLLRRREEFEDRKDFLNHYFAFAMISFVAIQSLAFGFDQRQLLALSLGCLVVMGVLYCFKPAAFPKLTAAIPGPFVGLLKLTGRRTLEIYVAHLVLFDIIGIMTDPDRFPLFQPSLFFINLDAGTG